MTPPSTFEMSRADHSDNPLRRRRILRDLVLRLPLVLVMLLLILSLVVFIAWLVILHPLNPTFALTSLYVSNTTLSHSKFAANYDIRFTINNTNVKVDLVIDHPRVAVMFEKYAVSERVMDIIDDHGINSVYLVRKMCEEKMDVVVGKERVKSVKDRVFKDISDDWSKKKVVVFDVDLFVRVRFEAGIWPTRERLLKISCLSITVEFSSTKGTGKLMTGGGKVCTVHLV